MLANLGHSGPQGKEGSSSSSWRPHAYSWVKKYAIVVSDDQPVLVFKEAASDGDDEDEAAPTALDQLKRVSHQGSVFEDLYAVCAPIALGPLGPPSYLAWSASRSLISDGFGRSASTLP